MHNVTHGDTVTPPTRRTDAVFITETCSKTSFLRTSTETTTCRMSDADLNEARRAAKRVALTKVYALQAETDSDGVVSLIVAPTDANSHKPTFMVSRRRPGVVSVARVDQTASEELAELGTITEAVWMVCHHARYPDAVGV
jgi:hypothetical protein